jgi:hypothetical protein
VIEEKELQGLGLGLRLGIKNEKIEGEAHVTIIAERCLTHARAVYAGDA